jgi:hypothetical protein
MSEFIVIYLLYVIMPLWLAAGFADWCCHRATDIAHTAGARESALHMLMLFQIGAPALAALFLEVNAAVLLFALAMLVAHEATAWWDVAYATRHRRIPPFEQHMHSLLEVLPLLVFSLLAALHWEQLLALVGRGEETADFGLRWKREPLPAPYLATLFAAIAVLQMLPYSEELLRCLRARRRSRDWYRDGDGVDAES